MPLSDKGKEIIKNMHAKYGKKKRESEAMDHPDKLGEGAKKREHLPPAEKREVVMKEFGRGTLHSGSGEKVTNPKQAAAIAYSEAGEGKK
jgi:hypothetical protein